MEPMLAEIAELPAAWRDAMSAREEPMGEAEGISGEQLSKSPILEGQRNDSLFGLARAIYGKGASESRVLAHISEVNELLCLPPLEPAEVRQIARSAYRYKPTEQSQLTRWCQCLLRSDLDRRERLVGLAIMSFADKDGGQCFPSQESIGERACYSRQHVARAVGSLVDRGWLTRYRIARPDHGWGYGYRLAIPDVTPGDVGCG
jgi:DNA-binding MarR family transcriptional regulator